MKIFYMSDVHIPNEWFFTNMVSQLPDLNKQEMLVLVGDVVPIKIIHRSLDFLKMVSSVFEMVYWVPGNHEYYHTSDIEETKKVATDFLNKNGIFNVFIKDNDMISVGKTNIIFSTLWANLSRSPLNSIIIQRNINDFRMIKIKGNRFLPEDSTSLFNQSINFIRDVITTSKNAKNVVFTHFAPSVKSISPLFKGLAENDYFANNLDDFIEQYSKYIDHWIHGHVHDEMNYFIGETNILSNPFGYYTEHKQHFTIKSIEVN